MRNKESTSLRLSPEARMLIEQMAKRLGIAKTDVIEIAVRRLAKVELDYDPNRNHPLPSESKES